MEELLEKYREKQPEVIFEWHDQETEAEGWIVINSLRGGAAGGGTRMRKGLTLEEVKSLAKVMEIKFSICGPPIGGAKSGINFDPLDPRKEEVLQRWFKAVIPLLKHYYGTGGDLNVDIRDVTRITAEHGLLHTQEGIVNGHFKTGPKEKDKRVRQLKKGVYLTVDDPDLTPAPGAYSVADLITGWGVAEAVRHYYHIFRNENLEGKKALIQGWGNVAAPAAFYLAKNGVAVTVIIDRSGGIIDLAGMNVDKVTELVLNRDGMQLSAKNLLSFDDINEQAWESSAQIFIPAAASKLVTRVQAEKLLSHGLEIVSCGANVPFKDDGVFHGPTSNWIDKNCGLIPDFIANCGMACVFSYLMSASPEITAQAIFDNVSKTIEKALNEVAGTDSSGKNITETSLEVALKKLMI